VVDPDNLSAVNYDPACNYRSNFHQGQYLPMARGGGLAANFLTCIFYQVTNYPVAFPHNISSGHYLPARFTALFWLVTKPVLKVHKHEFFF
jgi:hypothetical protein